MRAQSTLELSGVTDKVWQMMRRIYEQIARVVNGNISFGDGTSPDNVSGTWLSTTTPGTPGTDFTLTHNLGRVPVGYWIMQKAVAVDIYDGSTPATETDITLQATVGTVAIRIFVV